VLTLPDPVVGQRDRRGRSTVRPAAARDGAGR